MENNVRKLRRVARLLALLSLAGLVYGQGFGKIVGAVTDPQGLGVPGARVTVTEAATGLQDCPSPVHPGMRATPAAKDAVNESISWRSKFWTLRGPRGGLVDR